MIGDIPPCVKEVAGVWRMCVTAHFVTQHSNCREGGSCEDETNKNYSKLG